jgi:hypothetical protein
VLGLVHDGQFTLDVGEDPVVAAGDRLLLAVPDRAVPGRAGHPVRADRADR